MQRLSSDMHIFPCKLYVSHVCVLTSGKKVYHISLGNYDFCSNAIEVDVRMCVVSSFLIYPSLFFFLSVLCFSSDDGTKNSVPSNQTGNISDSKWFTCFFFTPKPKDSVENRHRSDKTFPQRDKKRLNIVARLASHRKK